MLEFELLSDHQSQLNNPERSESYNGSTYLELPIPSHREIDLEYKKIGK